MKSEIISQEEFMGYMPSERVLFFRFMDDGICLLSTFEMTKEGLRVSHFGKDGVVYSAKELHELSEKSIAEIRNSNKEDVYCFDIPEASILPEIREQFGENVIFYRSCAENADFFFAKELNLGEDTVFVCLCDAGVQNPGH